MARSLPTRLVLPCLLLAACGGEATIVPDGAEPPPDAAASPDGGLPPGAAALSPEQYHHLLATGGFHVLDPTGDAANDQASLAADEATIAVYAQLHPELGDPVPPPPSPTDPTVTPLPDGEYLHTVHLPGGRTIAVQTHGQRWWKHVVAERIRTFPKRDNQLRLYRHLFAAVPDLYRSRLALPAPDALADDPSQTADDVLGWTRKIASPTYAPGILAALEPVGPVLPVPFLSQCGDEIGAGTGRDLVDSSFDGSCDFSGGGIVRNHEWPLKQHLTCVRSQGNRGTCTGFASTSAIEILVHKTHGLRVNLSEQAFYNRARTRWDTPYGTFDGLMGELGLGGMRDAGWLLYFEEQWNYNPSPGRTAACVQHDEHGDCQQNVYSGSCDGYAETCSNTVHQSQLGCVHLPALGLICGYFVPEKNPHHYGFRIGDSAQFWDPTDKGTSLAIMQLLLAAGYPIVLGHPITTAWDCAEATTPGCPAGHQDGYMPYVAHDTNRGGHGSSLVGFIGNDDLAILVPGAQPGQGGGYFIIKNSWGNCWGDGGFLYAPYQSILDHAADATVLLEVL